MLWGEGFIMRHRFHGFWICVVTAAIALTALPGFAKDQPAFDPFASPPKDPNEDIDRHTRSTPKDAEESVAKLAAYLAKGAKNDREKARAIFTWMTANIAYDHDAVRKGGVGEKEPEKVLQIHRATCDGQSRLYEALAKAARVEVVRIVGDARSLDERKDIPTELVKRSPKGTSYVGHAWNAVKIDGNWQVLDVTWGNRRDFRDGKISERGDPNDYYFLVPPEQMIYTHLPSEEKWQLLSEPFTRDDQEALPAIRSGLFKNGLGLVSHKKALISGETELKVTLTVPADVVLVPTVMESGKKAEGPTVLVQRTPKQAEVLLAFPTTGEYLLRVAAGKKWAQTFDYAVEYRLEVKEGKKAATLLPEGSSSFQTAGGYLHAPLTGTLKAGKTVAFKVSLPGATGVFLKNADKTSPLRKQGQFYVGNVTPASGKMVLYVEDAASARRGKAWQAVTYSVE
jgi:hypothetical protein